MSSAFCLNWYQASYRSRCSCRTGPIRGRPASTMCHAGIAGGIGTLGPPRRQGLQRRDTGRQDIHFKASKHGDGARKRTRSVIAVPAMLAVLLLTGCIANGGGTQVTTQSATGQLFRSPSHHAPLETTQASNKSRFTGLAAAVKRFSSTASSGTCPSRKPCHPRTPGHDVRKTARSRLLHAVAEPGEAGDVDFRQERHHRGCLAGCLQLQPRRRNGRSAPSSSWSTPPLLRRPVLGPDRLRPADPGGDPG